MHFADRLKYIHEACAALLIEHRPDAVAIERLTSSRTSPPASPSPRPRRARPRRRPGKAAHRRVQPHRSQNRHHRIRQGRQETGPGNDQAPPEPRRHPPPDDAADALGIAICLIHSYFANPGTAAPITAIAGTAAPDHPDDPATPQGLRRQVTAIYQHHRPTQPKRPPTPPPQPARLSVVSSQGLRRRSPPPTRNTARPNPSAPNPPPHPARLSVVSSQGLRRPVTITHPQHRPTQPKRPQPHHPNRRGCPSYRRRDCGAGYHHPPTSPHDTTQAPPNPPPHPARLSVVTPRPQCNPSNTIRYNPNTPES